MQRAGAGSSNTVDGRATRWAHRRPELLREATEYVLEHGVTNLTLRPLAAALGITIATVVRQFGSKEQLLEEISQAINDELLTELREDPALTDKPPVETLRVLWRRWLDPAQWRQFRVMFELYSLSFHQPEQYRWFTESVVRDWLPPIEEPLVRSGMDPLRARTLSTLVLSILRGLHLALAATGDAARVDSAFELAISALDPTQAAITERHGPPSPTS